MADIDRAICKTWHPTPWSQIRAVSLDIAPQAFLKAMFCSVPSHMFGRVRFQHYFLGPAAKNLSLELAVRPLLLHPRKGSDSGLAGRPVYMDPLGVLGRENPPKDSQPLSPVIE
jgi:hypothetical protein